MSEQTWPEGVIARYLTVVGATVDLTGDDYGDDANRPNARCGGCLKTFVDHSHYISGSLDTAHHWAQEHAEKCRALPRPAVTR